MKKRIEIIFVFILLATSLNLAWGQNDIPVFIKDIFTKRSTSMSSDPNSLITMNGTAYFVADDGIHGMELWKSDGTAAGTIIVKDIASGKSSSSPSFLISLNGQLYFQANDGITGLELWKTDGTETGTVLVKDIAPGAASSTPQGLKVINNTLFFSASDGINGTEPWKSDGTNAGTAILKEIYAGSKGSNPADFTDVNGLCFFQATDSLHGNELWKTDGTNIGTVLVKDIWPGKSGTTISEFYSWNGILYISAFDGTLGREPWRSDGTDTGTRVLKDIYPGTNLSSTPAFFTAMNGLLYFTAQNGTVGGELWKTDGTTAATILVKDLNPGTATGVSTKLTVFNNLLFFAANNGVTGRELWMSDGTDTGTRIFKDINGGSNPSDPVILGINNGNIFLTVTIPTTGTELWKSDGTTAGTILVKDIAPGTSGSNPRNLLNFNGGILFNASDTVNGAELWRSDGTSMGTYMLRNLQEGNGNGNPQNFTSVNGTVFFSAQNPGSLGIELWKTNGTSEGTLLVKAINPGNPGSMPTFLTSFNGLLFFQASDSNGSELWKSDGTDTGTVLVKDIYPGSNGSSPALFTEVNGILYFVAKTPSTGFELWKSDGTTAGTVLVKDIYTGVGDGYPRNLINMNGMLYFYATDSANGTEFWKSDGTALGTVLVKNIRTGTAGSNPINFTNVNGTLFFTANDGINGTELWKSDGTTIGTVMVKDVFVGNGSSNPQLLINFNGTLFYRATDSITGIELWKSDGTSNGTIRVKDINPGLPGSNPTFLIKVNDTLYFQATDPINGSELWKSDGTATGTLLVKDIFPGQGSSSPLYLTNLNGKLYFTADDSIHGVEMWKSNGSTQGTELVSDIWEGSTKSDPRYLTALNGTLFFSANVYLYGYFQTGYELFKLGSTCSLTSRTSTKMIEGYVDVKPNIVRLSGSKLCFCDQFDNLLLAVDTSGSGVNIPLKGITLGLDSYFTTTWPDTGGMVRSTKGGTILNRRWNIQAQNQPIRPVTLTLPFTENEYQAIRDSLITHGIVISSPSHLQMFTQANPIWPASPHSLSASGKVISQGMLATDSTWSYIKHPNGNDHLSEFQLSSFPLGGGGVGYFNDLCIAIKEQPKDTTLCPGSTLLLTVNAMNASGYQWRKNGIDIAGAIGAIFRKDSVTTGDSGVYSVLIKSATACGDTISNVSKVKIGSSHHVNISTIGSQILCYGDSVKLYVPQIQSVTYQWKNSNGNIIGANDTLLKVMSTGNYKVLVTGIYGCKDSSSDFNVKVNPLPKAKSTAQGAAQFCKGNSVKLTADSAIGNTYQWNNSGVKITGGVYPTLYVFTSGNFYVVVKDSNNCVDSSTAIQVVVNPLPNVNLIKLGSDSFCFGKSSYLQVDSSQGQKYQWFDENGKLPLDTSSFYKVTVTGKYKVVVTGSNHCVDSSISNLFHVFPLPNAKITAIGNVAICQGESVYLQADSAIGQTFEWWVDTMKLSFTNAQYRVVSGGGYRVVVSNSNGCKDTSQIIQVTVHVLPKANLSASGPIVICERDSVKLVADTLSISKYNWMRGLDSLTGMNKHIFIAKQSGMYRVVVSNVYGCHDTSLAIQVVVNHLPITSSIHGLLTDTLNSISTYTVDSLPGSTFNWIIIKGIQLNSNGLHNAVVNWTNLGNAQLKVIETNNNGCVGDTVSLNILIVNRDTLEISKDSIIFIPSGGIDTLRINSNQSWTITDTSSWLTWSGKSGIGKATVLITAPVNTGSQGRYCMVTIGSSTITKRLWVYQSFNSGFDYSKENFAISIFPNPAKSSFWIQNQSAKRLSYTIVATDGKILSDERILEPGATIKHVISLPEGLYFIKLMQEDKITLHKLILTP